MVRVCVRARALSNVFLSDTPHARVRSHHSQNVQQNVAEERREGLDSSDSFRDVSLTQIDFMLTSASLTVGHTLRPWAGSHVVSLVPRRSVLVSPGMSSPRLSP